MSYFYFYFWIYPFYSSNRYYKNAASFAIFFYAFICFICNENKLKIILLYIIGVGIHSSILMLLPLFYIKK
ncbi:hypothetical protein ACIXOC_14840 [Bacteroides fragilis]